MLQIVNGKVCDPANGVGEEVRDIYIENGKIVEPPLSSYADETIDASGCVVLPGGVEIHSHIAGSKVNNARSMCPEDHYDHFKLSTGESRSGTGYTIPTTYLTGYLYSRLGYTTAFEAAVPPLAARHAHEELNDTPMLDSGMYTLMGNNYMLMKVLGEKDDQARLERLQNMITWLLTSSKGYAVKVVNPGGVESWKWNQRGVDLDTPVPPFGVTPRRIVSALAAAVEELKLPHAMHLHGNRLGEPGNYTTTLETMRTLEGLRTHFTHLQFNAYGATKKGGIKSAAPEVADYLNEHPEFTFDVGQIVFGPATTMTADAPMQFKLHQLTGNKWSNADVEMETGAGIVPMRYRPSILTNAVQWCIGLELLLLIKNPWQAVLTTDHPNGGPFTAYPDIIRLLMDRDYRQARIEKLTPRALKRTHLQELDREYTLEEIAIITRSAPAKILGLTQKGHLGAGADADVAIFREQKNKSKMFAEAEYVLKDGQTVFRDGQILEGAPGRRFTVVPDGRSTLMPDMVECFNKYYTVQLSNFAVQEEYLLRLQEIPCRRK